MQIGGKTFDTGHRTYIMGILNVTPDSFSDGGRFQDLDAALRHGEEMLQNGADLLDVGGESTRPGHVRITEEEEIRRVVPVIRRLKQEFDVPISVDTYKSQVARAALEAGADLVNDVWGLKYDPDMGRVIAEYGVPCCLMHNREKAEYRAFLPEVLEDLRESVYLAKAAGIREEQIILDPGIGFGKNYEMNLEMLKNLGELNRLGYPLLLGTSRKSVIGLTLDLPADEREEGTLVTTVMGVQSGCSFVRVHDVKANARAVKMTEAILRVHDL
ncbi:dihydropteroate synthase [Schaedlerella arabinosiphila]|uniref:dihydropteroate synthase n=1 Tax=Schaedlerella arabinosiphila TaxID=2044587 RepID=UPI002557CA25|nr:dihydropteroate synthase [Schaedlerella arabinosiphila]